MRELFPACVVVAGAQLARVCLVCASGFRAQTDSELQKYEAERSEQMKRVLDFSFVQQVHACVGERVGGRWVGVV